MIHMQKKALILVPHQDDEINLAGCLLEQFHENNIKVTIVFSTNGDSNANVTKYRLAEAEAVKQILDYDEQIYLGYGDGYSGIHVYNKENNDLSISICGKSETYYPGEGFEYCYSKYGVHHAYLRSNYKNDLKNVILDTAADIIICVDLDSHPDHRCLSLLFDEIMGDILHENYSYHPIILKGFAYLGVWHGPDDFFDPVIKETKPLVLGIKSMPYPYEWSDRICFLTSDNLLGLSFWKNKVFRALNLYETQSITLNPLNSGLLSFPRIVNADSVYWIRRTDNLAFQAQVQVTSGKKNLLTDFKLYDSKDITKQDLLDSGLYWSPDGNDDKRTIRFVFSQPVSASIVIIYQNPLYCIKKIRIETDSGYISDCECEQTSVLKLLFPMQFNVSELCLQILEGYESVVKVGEIEIFRENYNVEDAVAPLRLKTASSFVRKRGILGCLFFRYLYILYTQVRIRYNNRKYRKLAL